MPNVYYLGPIVGERIVLRHPGGTQGWVSGGLSLPYLGTNNIVGVLWDSSLVFDPGYTGSIFKRMDAASTGGTLPDMWGGTSDSLGTNRFITCIDNEAYAPFASLATVKVGTYSYPPGWASNVWVGFQLGWNTDVGATATMTSFIPIYKYTPPAARSQQEPGTGGSCANHAVFARIGNPILLLDGDKILAVTDLSVNTHNGALAFTRSYVQSKQSQYQFMGLGWTHNHALTLSFEGSPNTRTAWIRLEDGGRLKFAETGTANQFTVYAGSNATLTYASSVYTLTTPDNTQYVFHSTSGVLLERRFVNGDVWTYNYVSSKLDSVTDAYGHALYFGYVQGSGFDAGQLWRVGDQTASGLNTTTPTGRYVEFSYVTEKSDGSSVSNPKSLLSTVRDVRLNTWSYDYYGQHTGENTAGQLNFMTKRLSPPFRDAQGNIITGSELALETLVYTLNAQSKISAIAQRRGLPDPNTPSSALMTTQLAFNGDTTTETRLSYVTTHNFINEVYMGSANPAGKQAQQLQNNDYRPFIQVDENNHSTYLQWAGNGKRLEKVVDAASNPTTFTYDSSDRLTISTDAEGRKTFYIYDNARRQPAIILGASDYTEITTIKGDMEGVDADWSKTSFYGTNVLVTDPVYSGAKSRAYSSNFFDGIASAAFDLTAGKTYIVSVRFLTSDQSAPRLYLVDGNGSELASAVTPSSGRGIWRSKQLLYVAPSAVTGAQLHILNGPGVLGFVVDAVHLIEVSGLESWQEFVYDNQERTLSEQRVNATTGVLQQETTRTYVPSGNGQGLVESVTVVDVLNGSNNVSTTYTYDSAGRVTRTQQISLLGSCKFNYTVYDEAGNALRTLCSSQSVSNPATAPTTAETTVTVHEYDTLGRRTKTINRWVNGTYDPAQPADDQAAVTVYDALDRVIRTVGNYVPQGSSDPKDWYWNGTNWQRSNSDTTAISFGTNNDQNVISVTDYSARGLVRRTRDVLGNVTLYGYDSVGRLIKTVSSASQPDYNNDEIGTSPDPALANYSPNSAPDKDIITTTQYDGVGNPVKTVDVSGNVTYTVYDALNRVVKTVRNAKDSATIALEPFQTGYVDTNDPRSFSYVSNTDPDRDIIDTTEYDSMGRVVNSITLVGTSFARTQLTVYDTQGRAFRTVANYVDQGNDVQNWVWNATLKQWENGLGTAINHGTNADQNHISHTEYDTLGRVKWTQDVRGLKTWNVYDTLGRVKKTIVNCTYTSGSPAPEDDTYVGSSDADKDIITRTEYDANRRVWKTFDALGRETRFEYDSLGRRIKTITNYVDGVYDPYFPDEDLIQTTHYDSFGRVASTVDARGTKTVFTYDAMGRQIAVTMAADTYQTAMNFTCYGVGGRVLRTIQNWIDNGTSPNAKDGSGNWLFNPTTHGGNNDQNLITAFTYDATGRTVNVTDAVGNVTSTTYYKDGQVKQTTDVLSVVTTYRYDKLHRRLLVVQNYVDNGEDPSLWIWDDAVGQKRWEESDGTPIVHGTNNDQNIIALATYDKAGRMLTLRAPKGALNTYTYDLMGRRTSLKNALDQTWETTYALLTGSSAGGTTRTTLKDPNLFYTQRDTDLSGRLATIQYNSPSNTSDVKFGYDKGGNRTLMSEYAGASFSSKNRDTIFTYDKARRLTQVDFDNDGSSTIDETVKYEYDAGGRRTKLTLPGNLNVIYHYDTRGQLSSLTDWDGQFTNFAYDGVGRHVGTERSNGLTSDYLYNAVGHLRRLRHFATAPNNIRAHFEYNVDARGNRTRAFERVALPTTIAATYDKNAAQVTYTVGTWTDDGSFKKTTNSSARMQIVWTSGEGVLTIGTGQDHGIFDIYIGGSLWKSYDGFATTSDERLIHLPVAGTLEIRNRREKNSASSGYVFRFKQLQILATVTFDERTIDYNYDNLARLLTAQYTTNTQYAYTYDIAGNRTQQIVTIAGSSTTTDYDYTDPTAGIVANQLRKLRVNGGAWTNLTYDNNGNMTSDGTNTYTWDRANRLLSMGGSSYNYDGLGNRTKQTVGANVTKYLLDLQPGLVVVLSDTTGANTNRYIHSIRGIHAQKDASNNWEYMTQDGLGSVRQVVSNSLGVLESVHLEPFGTREILNGTQETIFEYTGEQRDGNYLYYNRARYLNPLLGIFSSLDPHEGTMQRPMSLNDYSYVEGNVSNAIDPSGECPSSTQNHQRNSISLISSISRIRLARFLSTGMCSGGNPNPPCPAPYCTDCTWCYEMYMPGGGDLCFLRCEQNNENITALAANDPVASSQLRTQILNSTVIIGLVSRPLSLLQADRITPTVPKSFTEAAQAMIQRTNDRYIVRGVSLGTITANGILTHDHFSGIDVGESANFLRSGSPFEFLYLVGVGTGNRTLRDLTSPTLTITSVAGTGKTLIQMPTFYLGNTSTPSPVNLIHGDPVFFPINTTDRRQFLEGWLPQSSMDVRGDLFDRPYPGLSYMYLLQSQTFLRTREGDSGAGHFDIDGSLIGVLFGRRQINLFSNPQQAFAQAL